MFSVKNLSLTDPEERDYSGTVAPNRSRLKIIIAGALTCIIIISGIVVALVFFFGGENGPDFSKVSSLPSSSKTDAPPSKHTPSKGATKNALEYLQKVRRSPQALWSAMKAAPRRTQLIAGAAIGLVLLVAIAVTVIAVKFSHQEIIAEEVQPVVTPGKQDPPQEEIPTDDGMFLGMPLAGFITLCTLVSLIVIGCLIALIIFISKRKDTVPPPNYVFPEPIDFDAVMLKYSENGIKDHPKEDLLALLKGFENINVNGKIFELMYDDFIPKENDTDVVSVHLSIPDPFEIGGQVIDRKRSIVISLKDKFPYNLLQLNMAFIVDQNRWAQREDNPLKLNDIRLDLILPDGEVNYCEKLTPYEWKDKIVNGEYVIRKLDPNCINPEIARSPFTLSLCYELMAPFVCKPVEALSKE